MPTTVDGKVAEVALNALGIINRLNMAQIQEQYINFMVDRLRDHLKTLPGIFEQAEEVFSFLNIINKKQAEFLEEKFFMMNRSDREDFIAEIINDGLFIHQTPFFGNTSMDDFVKIFNEKPYLTEKYEFVNTEKKMVLGDMYFIRLVYSLLLSNCGKLLRA